MLREIRKHYRTFAVVSLLINCVLFPYVIGAVVTNMAGETPYYSLVTLIGIIGVLVYSALSMFRETYIRPLLFYYSLLVIGMLLNHYEWTRRNEHLCRALRADTSCVFDKDGVHCGEGSGSHRGFSAGKSLCDGYV